VVWQAMSPIVTVRLVLVLVLVLPHVVQWTIT
jgi:hypothetical protein